MKKIVYCPAYSGLQYCTGPYTPTSSTSPSVLPRPRARPATRNHVQSGIWRSYASVKSSSKGYDFRDNMNWPCCKTSQSTPTPYEIFDIEKGAIYTKHKYYELVKIYHPDRNYTYSHEEHGITILEKIERYRLVVQAHEILSNPVKRKAYDAYGAGWGESRVSPTRHSRGFASSPDGQTYGYGPDHDNSPFANATWEDWERWYHRRDQQASPSSSSSPHSPSWKQTHSGTYLNPNAFASFVILLAVITGVAQATRAGQYSGALEEKAAAFTEETSRFLVTRAEHFNENKITSDGRIKHFLERRDPSRYGLKDEEEDTYRKHFSDGHIMPPPPPTIKGLKKPPDPD